MDNLFYRKEKKKSRVLLKKLFKNKRAMLGLVIGVPIAFYVVFGNRGVLQRIRLEQQKAELEMKISDAEAETRALQAKSKALEGDKKAIEKVARENYGMVRDGETVYKVNKSK
ncbi:MAG: septum formation initiator family protein [Ignavibacteriae bacterium]|nr:septum formation initiator family protein [Ignavibacteriota bacterium]